MTERKQSCYQSRVRGWGWWWLFIGLINWIVNGMLLIFLGGLGVMIVYCFQVVFKWLYNFVNFHPFFCCIFFFILCYRLFLCYARMYYTSPTPTFTSISIYTFKVWVSRRTGQIICFCYIIIQSLHTSLNSFFAFFFFFFCCLQLHRQLITIIFLQNTFQQTCIHFNFKCRPTYFEPSLWHLSKNKL